MNRSSLIPMSIIGVLFFIFGFVTWLNGSLIPFFKVICDLGEFQALFVTFSFYIAYTVMALPMASVLEKTGYKGGMMWGLALMGVGALFFIPAALSASFLLFLTGLFLLGTGLTLLQTASNPYVVHIGPHESAAMRISIMGLINKSAGVLAPLLFTAIVLSGLGDLSQIGTEKEAAEMARRLIVPYLFMAVVLFGLAALVRAAPLPELELEQHTQGEGRISQFPHLILGAVTLFFYVGIEVIAGDTIGLYGQSIGVENATALTAYTMAFMVLGYLLGVLTIPRLVSQETALMFSAAAGILFTFAILFSSEQSSAVASLWGGTLPDALIFVALLGLSNALVWPAVWPLALKDLGHHTARGSALLIMGIAGGALLPLLFGKISEYSGMQNAYAVGLFCYLFIFWYAAKGHKMRTWSNR